MGRDADRNGTTLKFNLGKLSLAMLVAVLVIAVPLALHDSSDVDADVASDDVEMILMAEPTTYEVSVTVKDLSDGAVKGGTIKINDRDASTDDTAAFASGSTVTLTMIPDDGYLFVGWESGDTLIHDKEATITVTEDRDYVAVFVTKNKTFTDGVMTLLIKEDSEFKGADFVTLVKHMGAGEITIPDKANYMGVDFKITSIGIFAFTDTVDKKVTEVTISEYVNDVNRWAFNDAEELESIWVADGNTKYRSIDGVLFELDEDGNLNLTRYPEGRTGTYVIPSSVVGTMHNSFDDCLGLTELTMPSVTFIRSDSFLGCENLKSLTMPASVGLQQNTNPFGGCEIETLILTGTGIPKDANGMIETLKNWKLRGMTETLTTIILDTPAEFTLPNLAEVDGAKLQLTYLAMNVGAGNSIFYETEGGSTVTDLTGKMFTYLETAEGWIMAPIYDVSIIGDHVGIGSSSSIIGHDAYISLKASEHYNVPGSVDVRVGGVLLDPSDYTYDDGLITIPSAKVTGQIGITAVGVPIEYEITFTGVGTESDIVEGEKVPYGVDKVITIELVDKDRAIPTRVIVKVDGVELDEDEYEYDAVKGASTATLTIYGESITGNISIIADSDAIPFDGDDNTMLYVAIAVVAIIAVMVMAYLVMKRKE